MAKKKPADRWEHLGVRVRRKMLKRLQALADKDRRSVSFVVREILEEALRGR